MLSLLIWPKVIQLSGGHCSLNEISPTFYELLFCLAQVNFFRAQNIFPKILVNFKIKNLATDICAKDLSKVAPGRTWVGKPLAGIG
jgi:hypothetical protein